MNNFQEYYQYILHEKDDNVNKIGIFPGAFKPPHAGHYYTALNACKDNDSVYIFASSKARALSTQNKSKSTGKDCDSKRYQNLIKPDSKFTSNLLSIQPAECARMTSASAVRAAIALKDKVTVVKNLPEGLSDEEKDSIYNIFMRSNDISNDDYGHITMDQMMAVWNIYGDLLSRESSLSREDIKITVSNGSPVRDTYDLVDNINNSEMAGNSSIRLYVGS